jgi:hypothetical protein
MYIFPVDLNDLERTEVIEDQKLKTKTLILKTYGLPMIFWGYLSAILIVVAAMWLASSATIKKLISYQDDLSLVLIGHLVQSTLILLPLILLAFFFYEKHLKKSGNTLTMIYKIFFITVFWKTLTLDNNDALSVDHFMDSPNVARLNRAHRNSDELRGFENKGYFELHALSGGKSLLIDRHSRKADLLKIKELLLRF